AGIGAEAVVIGTRVVRVGRHGEDRVERALRQDQVVAEVLIGGGTGASFSDDGVVVGQYPGGAFDVLQAPGGRVVHQVLVEIDRAAEHRLHAEGARGGIETAVAKDSNIAGAAVGFEAVVAHVQNVVAIEIDGQRHAVGDVIGRAIRGAVGGDIDTVVPVGHIVVRHDVALAVHFDRILGEQQLGVAGELRPQFAGPAHHLVRIVAADQAVVGDVEILRAGPIVLDGAADIVDV